jgi:hypothetical protein
MLLVSLLAATCLNLPAAAVEDRAVVALTQDLKQHAPSQWEIRVRWRDGYLLATITPQPSQAAFELVYAPAKMTETLIDLCPGAGAEVWSLVGSEQDVVLEPSVGGKAVVTARISCRKAKLNRSWLLCGRHEEDAMPPSYKEGARGKAADPCYAVCATILGKRAPRP